MSIPDFKAIREQVERIRAQKLAAFPRHSMVQVNSERFHGIGIVCDSDIDGCPLEKLAVRVESMNIWWYPLEDCQPYTGRMPSWIRSFFRQNKLKRVDAPLKVAR